MTFARRLVFGSILILVVTVGILFWVAEGSLRRDLEADIARTLESEARLVREALPADSTEWPLAVRRLAAQVRHRITLIDRDGRVVADSDFPPGPLPSIDNHADRPEVRTALSGARGIGRRRSETIGRLMLYVAVPGPPGVVRVAAGLEQVDEIVGRAQRAVAGAALLALLIGSLLALAAGRSIARPLVELGSAARAIAAGAPPRFPRSGIPEIDSLVQALREMHHQLADRFSDLRREQAETAALVESMVEGVIAADERGRIVIANNAARQMLGYSSSDVLPGLAELFRVKGAREVVDAVLQGAAVQDRELEMDGRVLLMNARPLPSGGAVLVIHDLTDLRRLEAMRRDFVANVSHELKTPLTSISGYAETLLTDAPDSETTKRFLATILTNARRMQRLVDNLLDLARLEAGGWQPEREPVDISEVAHEAWSSLADGARIKSMEFAVEVPEDAATVYADADAVRQVLCNLLENSLRHTPAEGRIVCRSRREGEGIVISVTDTGAGILREHLPRVFERFYRADSSRSREEGGTGLGLAIVKHLVE
ncbi:MAG TPA: histidine kinase dimerization/phospho-acceptor domain-containing protein, partial [Gemmatimonadales bacterium]|nr:histidine kinase dimerization/phospho-acceptor domain-containing protein [Gemmatimonadales bacterium]